MANPTPTPTPQPKAAPENPLQKLVGTTIKVPTAYLQLPSTVDVEITGLADNGKQVIGTPKVSLSGIRFNPHALPKEEGGSK